MRISIEDIYIGIIDISYISTDDFSRDFLGMNPSYYRSIKCRGLEPSTKAMIVLMEKLHQRADAIKMGGDNHQVLQNAAKKYEELAQQVGKEVAHRNLNRNNASAWVRSTLLDIISSLNEDRHNPDGTMPPIIIF